MSLGTWPIIGIIAAIVFTGISISRFVHVDDEKTPVASYDGGKTRRNRKGSRRVKK